MDNLFQQGLSATTPLAERMRPHDFSDFVGQEKLLGKDSFLRQALERDEVPSMILWGPPGCGKTTLASIIASKTKSRFQQLSAVASGKKDLIAIVEEAKKQQEFYHKNTLLFVDEIHRWSKAQQDALLPAVEKGVITLIGATTENPSFEVISALLSRTKVFVLEQLNTADLLRIIKRAAKVLKLTVNKEVAVYLAALANGDARAVLNTMEFLGKKSQKITKELIKSAIAKTLVYDKDGEQHYNLISALHKCMRASDPNAALYWLGRMLIAGEDPLYIARRVIRFASEDIGNERPTGLVLAVAAYQACHFLGMPECNLALAQAVEYCARAPKSRQLDEAMAAIRQDIENFPNEGVPMHLRNAPTKLMQELGYGKRTQLSNLPANLQKRKYL
ncbi:MAG: hypothetical protein A2233_05470 [Candidatus Kerfeldbacteria bacterium RIFOXYA2_FULL_38_24]|nr:MAG: hypothetical protein A2233_05470 [Candidatus Kerfeldbacteria bacterium RIFOXYA2_FULL_38_24]